MIYVEYISYKNGTAKHEQTLQGMFLFLIIPTSVQVLCHTGIDIFNHLVNRTIFDGHTHTSSFCGIVFSKIISNLTYDLLINSKITVHHATGKQQKISTNSSMESRFIIFFFALLIPAFLIVIHFRKTSGWCCPYA